MTAYSFHLPFPLEIAALATSRSVFVLFCCTLVYVHSSFAIFLMGKRELVALFSLSSSCLVIVVWLFLAVSWFCLQFVIVVLPDHTHYFGLYLTHLC